MTKDDDFFTNDDKPFSENLNDLLLLNNAFDVEVPIEMPKMFNNGSFVNSVSPRQCGVAIVTLNSPLSSEMSINNDGELTGTGTVQLRFYPNFNNFGGFKSITWDDTEDIHINLKKTDGTVIESDINNGLIESEAEELKIMKEILIEVVFNGATLHDFKVVMENIQEDRYGVNIEIDKIEGLETQLSTIEYKNTQQDSRLTDIESLKTIQGIKLTNMESNIASIRNYKITPQSYEAQIDYPFSVYVQVTDKNNNPIISTNVTLYWTRAKANTYPYQKETVTLTETTNIDGIATFNMTMYRWGVNDFQVGNEHCQVHVDGWRTLVGDSTERVWLLRNQRRAKVILKDATTSAVTWNWTVFVARNIAQAVRPRHDVVSLVASGDAFIRIDTNGDFWYMVATYGLLRNQSFYVQMEWEISDQDL